MPEDERIESLQNFFGSGCGVGGESNNWESLSKVLLPTFG